MNTNILIFYFLAFMLVNCTNSKAESGGPGLDYKLFNDTPVADLAKAVKGDNIIEINRLVKAGQDVNYKESKYGNNLLMLAVVAQRIETVETLLKLGANPNQRNFNDIDTAFLIAVSYSDLQNCDIARIKLLIKYGADVNSKWIHINEKQDVQKTALMIASGNSSDCLELPKILVENGADINLYTHNGKTGPLREALILDNVKIARYLIIDKKATIPEYVDEIFYGSAQNDPPPKKFTVTDLLNSKDYTADPKKQKIKEEILAYLKSIGKR